MNRGITQKQYLELVPPTEEDARSSQMRILDALKEKGITASFTLPALQKLYPICDEADYNITVSLAWNGSIWQVVDLEAGDTAAEHYGYAADLGSTTVVVRLVNCSDGTVLAEESEYNRQTAYRKWIIVVLPDTTIERTSDGTIPVFWRSFSKSSVNVSIVHARMSCSTSGLSLQAKILVRISVP